MTQNIEWSRVADEFRPDGALRDIYVHDATVPAWQAVVDHIRAQYPPAVFTVDGEAAPAPTDVRALLTARAATSPLLTFQVAEVALNCHFFLEDEIEFDFHPRDVRGSSQLEALQRFMTELGVLTGQRVTLTPENLPQSPILEFDPATETVRYIPAPDSPAA